MKKTGFSITELLIVVVIVIILAIFIVLAINPGKMMTKSRDFERNENLSAITTAIDLFLADNKNFKGLKGPYLSTSGASDMQKNDGTGWIPIKFNSISSGTPLSVLPLDPLNNETYHYILGVDPENKTYEINCFFELSENIKKVSTDGGNNGDVYEVGTDLTILP